MKNKTDCANLRENLKAYADDELSRRERAVVRRHLTDCADCREELKAMTQLAERIQESEAAANSIVLDDPLRTRLLDAVTPQSARAEDRAPERPLWRRQPLLVFGGGGAAIAASAAIFTSLYGTGLLSMQRQEADSSASLPPAAESAAAATGGAVTTSQFTTRSGKPVVAAAAMPAAAGAKLAMQEKSAYSALPRDSGYQAVVSGGVSTNGSGTAASATPPMADRFRGTSFADQDGSRDVHREASLGLEVSDIEGASDRITDAVKADGGYVASDNLSSSADGGKYAELIVKVPEKDFDTMMTAFAKIGSVVSKNISGEDITDKVGDSTSVEQALVDQATTLEDELRNHGLSDRRTHEKEGQLQAVRQQLAQTRYRLGHLRKMAVLATVDISLTEPHKTTTAAPTSSFWSGMHDSNRAAMLAFQAAVRVPLVLGIWLIALSPIWVPLLIAYRWFARKSASQR